MPESFGYRAFISYSHKDKSWGDWLHRSLESYRVPKNLIGSDGRDGPVPERVFPIFRDREELPSSADLNEQIKSALQQSAYLIVICSPNSAASRWVNEEILAFKRMGKENRVLALIVDGEPNAGEKNGHSLECFPEALKYRLGHDGNLGSERIEPIAADARPQGDGRNNAKLKLLAGLLGVGYDKLKQRDEQATRRRTLFYQAIAASMTLLAISAVGAGIVAYKKQREAEYQRNQAEQAQLRSLTQSAVLSLANNDVSTAIAVSGEIVKQQVRQPNAEALNTFLESLASDSLLLITSGHTGVVTTAMFSPNGQDILTASIDKTLRIWDGQTGHQKLNITGHTAYVEAATYSGDGSRIVSSGDEDKARLWDSATGQLLKTYSKAHGLATISPDGRHLVAPSEDNTAQIWNEASGKSEATLKAHTDDLRSAVYSADGRLIVTASGDGTAIIWKADSARQVSVLRGHLAVLQFAAFSPDGRRVTTASSDNTARIWSSPAGAPQLTLSGHTGIVYSSMFSSDGKKLVTASEDGSARIWDANTGLQLLIKRHSEPLTFAAFSPASDRIVTASKSGAAYVWDLNPQHQIQVFNGHTERIWCARFSPDGKSILSGASDGTARIWNLATGAEQRQLSAKNSGPVLSAVYSPDGRSVATTAINQIVHLWDAQSGSEIASLKTDNAPYSLAFSPDGKQLAVGLYDGTIRIWDFKARRIVQSLRGHDGAVFSIAYFPDGKRILTGSIDRTARLWDATTGKILKVLTGHMGAVRGVAFSPDGKKIATASFDKFGRVWDAETGRLLFELSGHENAVNSIEFSPDGTRLLTGSGDGTARLWNAFTGQELEVLRGHLARVASASFSRNGAFIVTASEDKTVRVWDSRVLDLPTLVAYAEAAEFDPLSQEQRFRLGLPPTGRTHAPSMSSSEISRTAARAERLDAEADVATGQRKAELLLGAFRGYATALASAQTQSSPSDTFKRWRYRRASIARVLARQGMMRQVADAYREIRSTTSSQ